MQNAEATALTVGVNQQGVRDHNERLILSLIQRFGPLPGSEVARRAGLSPQTASVIMRGLENDGLLVKGEPVRGRVGKPSVPMGLAPDGAFSIGLKIGRRSADLFLTDFLGKVRFELRTTYAYPEPDSILGFLRGGIEVTRRTLGEEKFVRISGIGIAMPYDLWKWHDSIGAPQTDMERWREIDVHAEIARFTDLPVFIQNDATSACRAELVLGRGREFRDYAYFFIGAFIGGGIVLNNSIFDGQTGNAGAFGSLPAWGGERQLIDVASLHLLEQKLVRDGIAGTQLWTRPQDWSKLEPQVSEWVEETAQALARAALTVTAVVDFEAVIIDGAFPHSVRTALIDRIRAILPTLDVRGLNVPRIEHGIVGADARALGAASSPTFSKYFLNAHGQTTGA